MSFNTVARKKGRNKDRHWWVPAAFASVKLPLKCRARLQRHSNRPLQEGPLRKLTLPSFSKIHNCLYPWQCWAASTTTSWNKQISAIGISNTHHSGNKTAQVSYLNSQASALHYLGGGTCSDHTTGIPHFNTLHFIVLHTDWDFYKLKICGNPTWSNDG